MKKCCWRCAEEWKTKKKVSVQPMNLQRSVTKVGGMMRKEGLGEKQLYSFAIKTKTLEKTVLVQKENLTKTTT